MECENGDLCTHHVAYEHLKRFSFVDPADSSGGEERCLFHGEDPKDGVDVEISG